MKVKVIIDRPLVEGVMAPDGMEQDCYVLGVDVPLKEFEGNLIAIIKRLDDVEEKWVIANKDFTVEEIKELTWFTEQYFNSFIRKVDVE